MRCYACGQDVVFDPTNVKDIDKLISREYGWSEVYWHGPDSVVEYGDGSPILIENLGAIEVLYSGNADLVNSTSDEMMILFEFNGSTYKKLGWDNSYGDRSWTGELTKAKQVTKTVTVWE